MSNTLLHRNKSNPLPDSTSTQALCDSFAQFFRSKIDNIRENFDNDSDSLYKDVIPPESVSFETFSCVTEDTIKRFLKRSSNKTSVTDPIPTALMGNRRICLAAGCPEG